MPRPVNSLYYVPLSFQCHSSQISFCYSCVRRLGVHQQLWHQPAPEPGGQAVCSTDPGSERAPVSSGCGRNEWCQRDKVRRSAWEALRAAGWQSCLQGEICAPRQIPVLLFHLILFLLLSSNRVIRSNCSIVCLTLISSSSSLCYSLCVINSPRSVFPRGWWGLGATIHWRCVRSWRRLNKKVV